MNRGQAISLAKRRHGHSRRGMRSPEYLTWCSMLRRCNNASQQNYKDYGARGIRVCDEWSGEFGFEKFFEHVGPKPSPKHSIDRIDGSKGYEPGNVRWATWAEQRLNRASVHLVEIDGRTQCVTAWEKELGIKPGRTKSRMHQGWPLPEALLLPTRAHIDPAKLRKPTDAHLAPGGLQNVVREMESRTLSKTRPNLSE